MNLQEFTKTNLAKAAQSTVEFADVTITSVFPIKPTTTGLNRIGVQTTELGTLYCLESQIQNPINSYKGGVSATVTLVPNTYTNTTTGEIVDTMRITNIVLNILTPEKQAELKMVAVTL